MAIALTLASAALAGCGGGTSTLSKANFISRADAICRTATAGVKGLAQPGDNATPNDTVAYVKQTLAVVEPALQRLAALAATPTDFVVLEKNLIAPAKDQVMAAHAFISDVQRASGDTAAEQSALTKFVGAATDSNQAGHDKALADFGFGDCSKTVGGTAPAPTTTTTTPPPPPFLARDASFSAVFPVPPSRRTVPINVAGLHMQTIYYRAVTANEDVSVAYILLPGTLTGAGIQSALNDSIDQGAAGAGGTVTSKNPITYLGSPAEDGIITAPGHIVHVRVAIIGRRFYVLQGVNYSSDAPHPNYDELLATFHIT